MSLQEIYEHVEGWNRQILSTEKFLDTISI